MLKITKTQKQNKNARKKVTEIHLKNTTIKNMWTTQLFLDLYDWDKYKSKGG